MALRVSTAFKAALLGGTAFAEIFRRGRILVYSGLQPTSADQPPTGTLLGQITNNGDAWVPGNGAGLLFSTAGAYVTADSTQQWKLAVSATGTAGWFRLVAGGTDDGYLSVHAPRIDGTVGVSFGELILPTVLLVNGQKINIHSFTYTIP